ncbi:MAG: SPOR domain-containing protein [Gammaproteobacteria bacterium]
MKVAVLILVLVNFALFAWLRWAQGPSAETDLVPMATAGKPTLALLPSLPGPTPTSGATARPAVSVSRSTPTMTAAPAVSATSGTSSARAATDPAFRCLLWGPIASATAAAPLAASLAAAGYSARVFKRDEEVPGDYRVLLVGFHDVGVAEQAAAALRQGGVKDLYLQPASKAHGPSLSLGLFHDRAHARKRAARVRALGFEPRVERDMHREANHYVEIRMPAAASTSAALHAAGIARKPRREACTAISGGTSVSARLPLPRPDKP